MERSVGSLTDVLAWWRRRRCKRINDLHIGLDPRSPGEGQPEGFEGLLGGGATFEVDRGGGHSPLTPIP